MEIRGKVVSNFFWRLAERCGAQIVSFLTQIVLARMLSPEDYGVVALLTVFINVLSVFIDSGFTSALVQKENADDLDFSSIFAFNVVSCLVIYILLYISAPYIALFYNKPELTDMTRVLGFTLLISGVKCVQIAYVTRNFMFKKFFYSTLGGTLASAIIGIVMATCGFGAWAIIFQSLSNNLFDTLILWLGVKWRPRRVFSFSRLKGLFIYSWKVLVAGLIGNLYGNLRSLIIGKVYSTEDLAFYNRGQAMPSVVMSNIDTSINSVLFPAMSAVQSDCKQVKSMTRRSMKLSTYVMAPLMMGIAVCSVPIIRLVLTDKWLPAVQFQVIICITYMFEPVHTCNLNAIKAMGRSDLFLKLEIYKKVIGLLALAITVPISVKAMAYSVLITSVISQVINSRPNKMLMDYGYREQLRDILPGIALATAMGLIIYPITMLGFSDVVTLLIMVPIGAVFYLGGSIMLKLDSFEYLWNIIQPHLPFRKNSEEESVSD